MNNHAYYKYSSTRTHVTRLHVTMYTIPILYMFTLERTNKDYSLI